MEEKFYEDPRFWVAIAFLAFFVLFGKKVWGFLASALDGRAARISAELNEARALREEAEGVLAAYRQKYESSVQEADSILTHAREEADLLIKQAQAELKTLLETRARLAEQKIAQAEKQALEEVRQHVADITVATARALIIENIDRIQDDALVRAAINDLERKVH